MENKYRGNVNEIAACEAIAEIKSVKNSIDWSKYFISVFAGILCFVLFGVASLIVYKNFYQDKDTVLAPIKVKLFVESGNDAVTAFDVTATKQVLQETAQQAFYLGRKEAQEEYDNNFTTLLTILTVFGIVWPVIIALLQFKFNEEELKKIDATSKDAKKSLKQSEDALQKGKKSLKQSEDALQKGNKSLEDTKMLYVKFYKYQSDETLFAAINMMEQIKDWNDVDDSIKSKILYLLGKSIENDINAICVDLENSNNMRVFIVRIKNMCGRANTINPLPADLGTMYLYQFLISQFNRIPENEEKEDITSILQNICNGINQKCEENKNSK